ncbi:hypothetical protein OPKNFCMD_4734 [Methylobacterium crusticola]|uniref:Uncharacterized protein n=1 Tax=Methylobacterium crusticola TaxID=1697972 RepID=A0ABQ4R2S6_9HYPH|nr:hypothetical protein [Methylobacterium crusticola]GJD51975.1 hypothetical protein OPKNFCMD_4734 [Methylobacterium crusticola]
MTPDFLVIAPAGDASAGAVAAALTRRHGAGRVAQLPTGQLARCRWTHRVAPDGAARTRLRRPDGAALDCAHVRCVLDRMLAPPTLPRFARSHPKDRDYAAAEFHALLASWLAGFGPRLINPAGPWTLVGGRRPRRAWMLDAASRGLPVPRDARATAGRLLPADAGPPSRAGRTNAALPGLPDALPACRGDEAARGAPAGRVLIAGDFVGGSLAGAFGEACRHLAGGAGYRLAGFAFSRIGGRLVLSDVDTVPALADEAEVEAVARLLADVAAGAGGGP